MKEFTKETLSNYDGKNGRPAYIAVNGVVYDVTNNSHCVNGEHHGMRAGRDVSFDLTNTSPHGAKVLVHTNKVGTFN